MLGALFFIAVAYLLGSIPTGVVLTRGLTGRDIREHGSGNIGAANVVRTSGIGIGAAVGLVDLVKGLVPVLAGRMLGLDHSALALVAVVAVLGHDYSLFLRFRGGKGVATTLGAALALAPLAAALVMLAWVLMMLAFRYASLASLTALCLLPVLLALTGSPRPYVLACAFLFLLAVWKHRDNIVRLWNGKEAKFRHLKPANGS